MSLLSRLAVSAARAYGALSSNPNAVSASYLVVAGGGGAGSNASIYNGGTGGGGAGGFLNSTFTLSTLNTYAITVGAGGGAGASATVGSNGIDSVISGTGLTTVTSVGGGGGGKSSATVSPGSSGGSGGGGGGSGTFTNTGGSATSGQGNAGGTATHVAGTYGAAGGGGAGAVGGSTTNSNTGGNGGNGSASSISGSSVTYAGGGGGGAYAPAVAGTGGSGGGGNASNTTNGSAGTANLGGGGGGTGITVNGSFGGAGGSGIVIISYTSATPKFVGGTLTTSGGNQIHTFTSSGTLSPLTPVTASYLVVAGGGGGGSTAGGRAGGGGGAGGLLTSSTTIYSGATYVVTVGAGGASVTSGANSSLAGTGLTTITSTGGGGGGYDGSLNGLAGGSGGGASAAGTGGTATASPTQGNNGGNGGPASSNYTGGGGGGAGAVGGAGASAVAGNGGAGTASSISGSSVTYAGGGGGGSYNGGTAGSGGSGGGGAGFAGNGTGVSGTTNTGGGAGGSGSSGGSYAGATGGSGTVIISYAGSQVFNGGLVTSSGGNTIHTFNATGALTPLTNNLNNSLRFRSSASAYLSRTPTLATNRSTWTWSAWVKLGNVTTRQEFFSAGSTPNSVFYDDLQGFGMDGVFNATRTQRYTSAKYRDPSAWYHIVAVLDTTQATAADRMKMYVNGSQVALDVVGTGSYPAQNSTQEINNNVIHNIGRRSSVPDAYMDSYITEINFVDGQALEPYYFGNNDAYGNWKPILYKGTYGTNGFYLTFADTSALTTSSNAGLGKDTSGNGNYWTTNNISITAGSTYDAMLDVPTNTSATVANYCVLSPLNYRTYTGSIAPTITNGNLNVTTTSTVASCIGVSTLGVTSGKWYFEVTFTGTGSYNAFIGVVNGILSNTTANDLGYYSNEYSYISGNGNKYNNNTSTAYGSSYTGGDVIGVALDLDAGTLTFYKNNVSQGTAYSSLPLGDYYFAGYDVYRSNSLSYNFGQQPFAYTPPTGYLRWNTYNLSTPTILQGNKYMDATLYSGNAVGLTAVNQAQFKPDLVWIKDRTQVAQHVLTDSVRGTSAQLFSSLTNAEQTNSTYVTSFNTNGFTVGVGNAGTGVVNNSGDNFVGWQWQAGQGSTSSNTSGSITSTVSVNTTAGFSVVTYTGTGANATVGHGLGVAPAMIIVKNRSGASDNWTIYQKATSSTPQNDYMFFTAAAKASASTVWQNTAPTSSVFSIGTSGTVNTNTNNFVAYCWSEIAGFSKFGSWTGNGSTDGPFIYLGFRPKFIMWKETSTALYEWNTYDSVRNTYNIVSLRLNPSSSGAELDVSANFPFDFLSNGFKIRGTNANANANGYPYIYAAFAENPFKNSNAR